MSRTSCDSRGKRVLWRDPASRSVGDNIADRELEQQFSLGPGEEGPRVEADFGAESNQTTIRREEPEPKIKVLKPGLDLLRVATAAGKLSIEF